MKISRYGAYGILCNNSQIFLTLKISGPYKGKWDLPGGKIEFGETPEEALKREFLEEAAFAVSSADFVHISTYNGAYEKEGQTCHFHHIGIIYKVKGAFEPHLSPQEEGCWMDIARINLDILTPFAQKAIIIC